MGGSEREKISRRKMLIGLAGAGAIALSYRVVEDLKSLKFKTCSTTVADNDTLSQIAKEHGESLGDIETDNPDLTDPNVIHPGEKIIVKCSPEKKLTPRPTHTPTK